MVLQQLRRRLSPEELKECVPLEGKETTLSQHYPDEMVLAILKGISDTVKHDQCQLPDTSAFHVHVVTGVTAWQQVFQSAEHTFNTSRGNNFVIPTSDPLWKMVVELTGWEKMERIQLSHQPITWRFPTHLPHTHRGAALWYNDDTQEVIEEDVGDVRHPRGRFKKAVRIGVFFFGYAEQPRPSEQQAESNYSSTTNRGRSH